MFFIIYPRSMAARELNFLTSPPEILKALLNSKEEGTSIGLRASAIGEETIVTSVEDIIFQENETIIVLKPYDATGYFLPSRTIKLRDIEGVFPFSTPFENPFLNNMQKDKTWFF